jgi:hypothetical protein
MPGVGLPPGRNALNMHHLSPHGIGPLHPGHGAAFPGSPCFSPRVLSSSFLPSSPVQSSQVPPFSRENNFPPNADSSRPQTLSPLLPKQIIKYQIINGHQILHMRQLSPSEELWYQLLKYFHVAEQSPMCSSDSKGGPAGRRAPPFPTVIIKYPSLGNR